MPMPGIMPSPPRFENGCIFCDLLLRKTQSSVVFEDDYTFTFLDHRPLFPGHCLLIPKSHFETIEELPDNFISPVFLTVRMLSAAVRQAMSAEGTFVAANNRVSQSVAHFHVHIVPRRKGDGLKGFFWPRRKYKDAAEVESVLKSLQAAIASQFQTTKAGTKNG